MKKIIFLSIFLFLISGCRLLEDVGGVNLTPCEGNWDVCWDLYWQNRDLIDNS